MQRPVLPRLVLLALCALLFATSLAAAFQHTAVAGRMERWILQPPSSASRPGLWTAVTAASPPGQGEGYGPGEQASAAAWEIITEMGFEGSFPSGKWSVWGNPSWGKDDFKPHSGGYSAWCARVGTGSRDPDGNDYPNDVNAFMKYGPFDLSDATAAELTLYLWLDSQPDHDWFRWMASADGAEWHGRGSSGNTAGQWRQHTLDLCNVPVLGSLCGDDEVWIGIAFTSDASVTAQGAFVDDIVVRKQVLTPTPPPEGCVCESDHPYRDYQWGDMCTLDNPDASASCTRVHFSRIDLGQGAVIRLKQGNGQTYQEIRGPRQASDFWSDCVPGTTVLVELETGSYAPAWGFCIDQVGETVDTTPPTISNVRADPQAVNQEGCGPPEQVTISAEVTDAQSGVARVELHYQAPGEAWQIVPMSAGTGSTYSATVGPFDHAGTLRAQVRAFDQAGNDAYSTPALEVTVNDCTPPDTTPPQIYNVRASPEPINRDGCPAPNRVTISASIIDDQSGLDWARLHYQPPGGSWTSVAMPYTHNGSYSASVTIGPFANAGELRYYIQAADLAGNQGQSGQYTLTVDDCCALTPPVLDPIDNADCDADYTLTWSQVPGASEYWIRYSDNDDMSSPTTLWPASTGTSRSVTAPSPGWWYYQVRADSAGCEGEYSSVQAVRVWPVITQATYLDPIDNDDCDGDYDVTWSSIQGASWYELQEDDQPGFPDQHVVYDDAGTTYRARGQSSGDYYYRVRACNCRDCGPWSQPARSTTVLGQPTLLPILNTDCDDEYTLTWTPVPGATEYWIRYDDNPAMSSPTDLWPAWLSTSRSVTAPSPGTWYYQVLAASDECEGEYGNVQSVRVWPVPPKTSLQPIINPDQSSSYDVNWLPAADADYYEYVESQNPSFSGAVGRTTTATRLSVSGKAPGQWYYKVRACNCRDCGEWSVVQSTVVAAQAPLLLGNTSCTWGSRDCNPCANNVVAAFNSLRYRGDILGFNLGEHPDVAYDESSFTFEQHWQGIQRIAAGDGRTMVVSHDNVNLTYSVLGVVRMGSRNGSGDRYRSNRLRANVDIADTIPWSGDVIAQTVWIDDLHAHPGSIQSMGSFLVVGTGEEIHFYDFQNPLSPLHLGPADPNAWDGIGHILYRSGKSGSSTAMGQLQDGRYLLVVANSDAKDLDFYVSQQSYSLQQPGTYPTFQNPYPWDKSQVSMGLGEFTFYYDWDTFQNISLVTECGSGQLYLIATGNLDITANCVGQWFGAPCYPNGLDYASLYQVQLVGGRIVITKVAEHWFDCEYRGEDYCNFDAAAGAYVDPQGQLILYAAEHASDGPANSIKMMEFRPMPPGKCDTAQGAWVELYKEPGYTGRSIMIDYVDQNLEDYSNYDRVEDFEDQASSVQWCLPPGLSYVLRQDKNPCGGGLLQLFGDGSMHGIPHLSQYGWDHPDGGRVSCSYFWPVTPVLAQISALTGGTLVYNTLQPSPPQGSSVQDPAAMGAAAEQGASTTVQIAPGAVSQNIELTYTPRFPPAHDPQPLLSPAYAFELEARAGGVPLHDLIFAAPAQITIDYDGAALSEMVDSSTLMLGLYDEAAGAWVDASTTCGPAPLQEHNREDDWLRVGVCRIGEMALLAEPIQRFMKLPIVLKSYDRSQRVRPTPTAPPVESLRDNFGGPSLAREWWWRNENTANWSLTARPGFLRINSGVGELWQENLLLRAAPSGDFAVMSRLLFEPVANYQYAGIVLYQDDQNYLVLGRAFCDSAPPNCVGNGIYFDNTQGGQSVGSNYARPTASLDEAYLRVARVGSTYFGYYSADGQDWYLIGTHTLATANLSAVGVSAGQDQSGMRIPAEFDFLEMKWQ